MKLLLAALGTVLFSMLAADFKDARVCHWLAHKLIGRAVLRLPESERARWEEEWLRHDLDVPGRILPLARAVQIFVRADSWGRLLRGAPSRLEVVKARLRAVWQRLRSRPEVPPQEPPAEPAARRVEADPAIAAAVAGSATVAVTDVITAERSWRITGFGSQRAFEQWLDDQRRDFDAWLARKRREADAALNLKPRR